MPIRQGRQIQLIQHSWQSLITHNLCQVVKDIRLLDGLTQGNRSSNKG
jgi:hypothetical protein